MVWIDDWDLDGFRENILCQESMRVCMWELGIYLRVMYMGYILGMYDCYEYLRIVDGT